MLNLLKNNFYILVFSYTIITALIVVDVEAVVILKNKLLKISKQEGAVNLY